jgi:para-aminobenzoate synthetase/4-amino-4-deoxychorismate lyase
MAEDTQLADRLATSPKDQAENIMIVDLMRNDLGRISQPGTVNVKRLFSLEQYPTVWQMTSEVSANLKAPVKLACVFRALFPCGSVTGAPKVTAMRRIAALERSPRGVYCGAIGFAAPGGDAIFNVAIRTAVFNHADNTVTFGSGGGITWDSDPQAEYEEMRSKSLVLRVHAWQISLLESILLTNGRFLLLDQHINRLKRSASYFAIEPNWPEILHQLEDLALQHPGGDWKVRVMLDRDSSLAVEALPLVKFGRVPLHAALSTQAVDSSDFKLYHKTTDRRIYSEQSKRHPNCDEVLMQNERGELTEFLNGNLVIESAGRLFTPPVTSGLLPGVMREYLITIHEVQECVIYPHNLYSATRVWFINSVRGKVPVEMIPNV